MSYGGTIAVSTRHLCEPFAIDHEQFAICCSCPHGRNRNSPSGFMIWNERAFDRIVEIMSEGMQMHECI